MNPKKRVIESEDSLEEREETRLEYSVEKPRKEEFEKREKKKRKFQIEILSLDLKGEQDLCILYEVFHGENWSLLKGERKGATFFSRNSDLNSEKIFFNFFIEFVFESFGTETPPMLVFTVLGYDFLCRETVNGYSSLWLPLEKPQESFTEVFQVQNPNPFFSFMGALLGKSTRIINPFKTLYLRENWELLPIKTVGTIETKILQNSIF